MCCVAVGEGMCVIENVCVRVCVRVCVCSPSLCVFVHPCIVC
jgi:hypothetical protein